MQVSELDYSYPESSIATEPALRSRILRVGNKRWREQSLTNLLDEINQGDVFVINDTKVSPRRVVALNGTEVLFVKPETQNIWQVLFPARGFELGDIISLPGERRLVLLEKGLPQKVRVLGVFDEAYFTQFGEMALPPYIQKARSQRRALSLDKEWYQTQWAQKLGSSAAPTASLHWSLNDLDHLKKKGVEVVSVTLHVGLGTFLPVKTNDLESHRIHKEWIEIPSVTRQKLLLARQKGRSIWALGTTVARVLESIETGALQESKSGDLSGWTDLFIRPGYSFHWVDRLMTNFHQPRSTLLALVCAFAGRDRVLEAYQWAIEEGFRLFSYGDLSVWDRKTQ